MLWKKKIDDQEEAQRQARERAEAEQKARKLAEQKEQEERSRKDLEAKYRNLAQRFKCHICHKSSHVPLIIPEHWRGGSVANREDGVFIAKEVRWDNPADLWQCKNCNKLTCADHIYKGICQACAEKM